MRAPAADSEAAAAAVSTTLLLDAVDLLASTPSPPGGERSLADRVAAFGSERVPEARWSVVPFGEDSANVMAVAADGTASSHLGLYAHLDTSLTGDAVSDRSIRTDVCDESIKEQVK